MYEPTDQSGNDWDCVPIRMVQETCDLHTLMAGFLLESRHVA